MKVTRRIALITAREARAALAAKRAGRDAESIRKQRPSFRPLSPHGRLILMVLGGLVERHLIITRTSEGRKRAQAHGVLFGRPRAR